MWCMEGPLCRPMWEEEEISGPEGSVRGESAGALLWVLWGDLFHTESEGDTGVLEGSEVVGADVASFAEAQSTDEGQDHNCEGTEMVGGGAVGGEIGEALE